LITGLLAAGFLAQAASALAVAFAGRFIARFSGATGFLAMAHARAQSRRMATVVAIVAVTDGLTVTLKRTVTVPNDGPVDKTRERIMEERVGQGDHGITVTTDERLRAMEGVAAVTRITETSVALQYFDLGESAFEFFPAAAITSDDPRAT